MAHAGVAGWACWHAINRNCLEHTHLHMARSVRCRHFGDTFKWLAYGDDDTFFFLDAVVDVLSGLDPAMPYFLTGAGCLPFVSCA